MDVLALDLSTKPGFAFYRDKKLVTYGTLYADQTTETLGIYPYNYIALALHTAKKIQNQVLKTALGGVNRMVEPLNVVIEETTSGAGNNYSQKKLEFIHYAVLEMLREEFDQGHIKIWYVRDGSWKSAAGVKLNDAEKLLNKQIAAYKKLHKTKLAKLDLGDGRGLRVVGKKTIQHVYIRVLNEVFGIQLAHQEEDQAAAILMGYAFYKGVKLCNGIVKAGPKKTKKVKP